MAGKSVVFQPCETCPLLLCSDPFDSHDDRDDDPEGESVEEHKSVIMHLLSQVRLGMDLTKVKTPSILDSILSLLSKFPSLLNLFTHCNVVCTHCFLLNNPRSSSCTVFLLHYISQVVLPTFILERRSLLEMYADFFAHPDLFVR